MKGIDSAQAEITKWLIAYLSQTLDVAAENIDTDLQFDSYGLDSMACVSLIGELGERFQLVLEPERIYDYPSINTLAEYCAKNLVQKSADVN